MPSGASPSTNSTLVAAHDERERGVASEEREPAPPLRVLDRLEQEPFAVADQLHERRERGLEVGEHLAPHRHDRILAAQRDELVERRSHPGRVDDRTAHHRTVGHMLTRARESRRCRSRGRSTSARRCGTRPAPPARRRRGARPCRSRTRPGARTDGRPRSRPCTRTRRRLRLQNQVRPVSRVRRSDSRFIQANISTWPVDSSWTIAATRPLASNATASSSASLNGSGVVTGAAAMRGSVVARAWNAAANRAPAFRLTRGFTVSNPERARLVDHVVEPASRTSAPPCADCGCPHILRAHGDERIDDWFWLRERANPDVRAYLEAENAYTDAIMRPTEPLQTRIYDEIASRVQQTDTSAPVPDGPYEYYHRTEEGRQYAIHCRRRAAVAPRRSCSTSTLLAAGHTFLEVGDLEVDDRRTRSRRTPSTPPAASATSCASAISRPGAISTMSCPTSTTASRGPTTARRIFYVRPDAAMRPDSVWRHTLGTPAADDVLVFRDDDERFDVAISRTSQRPLRDHPLDLAHDVGSVVRSDRRARDRRPPRRRAPRRSRVLRRALDQRRPTTASTSSPTPTAP